MNVNAFVRPAVPAKLRRPINCFEDLRIRGFATLTTVHFGQKLACCWLRNLRQSPRYAANSAFHLLLNWKRAVFAKQARIALAKASLSAFFCNIAACACTRYADMPQADRSYCHRRSRTDIAVGCCHTTSTSECSIQQSCRPCCKRSEAQFSPTMPSLPRACRQQATKRWPSSASVQEQ